MLLLSCFRWIILQSNLPNEKSQRTETVYDGKTLCNCQWEEPSANPSSGNAAMLLNFWTHKCPWPMVHVWLLYQASCQDAVFSATHGRSFVGVPKAALGSVLGCPPPRKDKGNQFSVSTMLFHPTKNLQKYPFSYVNGTIEMYQKRRVHHGHNRPLCPPLDG